MGEEFGAGLTQIEVDWLIHHEWAQTAEDILLRRTKIGLSIPQSAKDRLQDYVHSAVQNKN